VGVNQELKKIYEKHLSTKHLKEIFGDRLDSYSAPFLLNVDESYFDSDKKILFVGKETNKWWGKLKDFAEVDNGVSILQDRYRAELFGGKVTNKSGGISTYEKEPNWSNPLFLEYKKIRKALLDDKQGSLVWSNLLKMDNAKSTSYSRNTNDDKNVVALSKKIFKQELELLKPDFIIFAVSYTYDSVIKEFFSDEIHDSNVIEPKSLWKFKVGDTICYRTWHPSTIKYKAKKNKFEYYIDIINDIRSNND
jgi:hypothetical protein